MFLKVRRVARTVHKWSGLALGAFLMLLAFSGVLLVGSGLTERWFAPQRYAVTSDAPAQSLATFAAHAVEANHGGDVMRMQFSPSGPVVVWLRTGSDARRMSAGDSPDAGEPGQPSEHHHRGADSPSDGGRGAMRDGAGRPRGFIKVYLDPGTGKVLDIENPRAGVIATLRAFHTNLLVQGPLGRQIVGACGIVLLLLALSGILVWWPRIWRAAMRFHRGATLSINLHQYFGAWVALPLAFIAFTGIYLAFPQQLRPMLAKIASMSPQEERRGTPLQNPHLDPDAAFAAASGNEKLRLIEFTYPTRNGKAWRIEAMTLDGQPRHLLVDDASASISGIPERQSGDVISDTLRHLHMNQGTGPVWAVIDMIIGLSPILFFITGVLSWLARQKRHARVALPQEESASEPAVMET